MASEDRSDGDGGGNSRVFSSKDDGIRLVVDGLSFGYVLPHGKYTVNPRNVMRKPNRSSLRSLILYRDKEQKVVIFKKCKMFFFSDYRILNIINTIYNTIYYGSNSLISIIENCLIEQTPYCN